MSKSKLPSGADPGFWSGGAQCSFDPKRGEGLSPKFAQNSKIGVFSQKLPENCMI